MATSNLKISTVKDPNGRIAGWDVDSTRVSVHEVKAVRAFARGFSATFLEMDPKEPEMKTAGFIMHGFMLGVANEPDPTALIISIALGKKPSPEEN